MKLRPVVLTLLLLCGVYYLTTRLLPIGALAGLLHVAPTTETSSITGPLGTFGLTEARAAPAFDAEEQENIAVYKRALPSVVNITSTALEHDTFYLNTFPVQGQGSGFLLDTAGHIMTNYHVVKDAQLVEVTLWNQKKYKAAIIGVDKSHDIALLQIKDVPGLIPATLAAGNNLIVGQKVYAIGNPFGFSGTMTEGIVSAIRSIATPTGSRIENAIQTDASINPGNSGGPLLNSHGEVIGITTIIANNPNGGADQSAGIGFAIPISTVRDVRDDFARYGHSRRPSLDIVPLPIGPDIAEQIGLPADYGILIDRVIPGGAAAKANLRGGTQSAYLGNTPIMLGGDLIVAIDGQPVTTAQDYSNSLNSHHAGDTVVLTIFRGRQRLNVSVTLSEAQGEDVSQN
jgi:S1-C subfamily serine protease